MRLPPEAHRGLSGVAAARNGPRRYPPFEDAESGAVVLFSGGADSAAVLATLREVGAVVAVWVDYGQPSAAVERWKAIDFCGRRGIELVEMACTIPVSGLLDTNDSSPVVHGRNAILLAMAAALAASRGWETVAIGSTAEDAALFPDCRGRFRESMTAALQAAELGVHVIAPFETSTKGAVFDALARLGVAPEETWSCYSPHGIEGSPRPCGVCLACTVRAAGLDQSDKLRAAAGENLTDSVKGGA